MGPHRGSQDNPATGDKPLYMGTGMLGGGTRGLIHRSESPKNWQKKNEQVNKTGTRRILYQFPW